MSNNLITAPVFSTNDACPYLPDLDHTQLLSYLLMTEIYKGSKWVNAAGLDADSSGIELNAAEKKNLEAAFKEKMDILTRNAGSKDDKKKDESDKANRDCVYIMQQLQEISQKMSNINQTQIQPKLSENQASMQMIATLLGNLAQLAIRG
jgi:hypothetical protein